MLEKKKTTPNMLGGHCQQFWFQSAAVVLIYQGVDTAPADSTNPHT